MEADWSARYFYSVRLSPCEHNSFHAGCIFSWLSVPNRTCPICRAVIQNMAVLSEEQKNDQIAENKWLDIPTDLLEIIANHLHILDFIRLKSICKDWHFVLQRRYAPNEEQQWPMLWPNRETKHFQHQQPQLPQNNPHKRLPRLVSDKVLRRKIFPNKPFLAQLRILTPRVGEPKRIVDRSVVATDIARLDSAGDVVDFSEDSFL
ncbi:hypothetical protein QJS04_geneDACA013074 [Acorus gramineus]|uniref:F-box domain-containing protein n=1 Tax=Acorus gramineus TaxID=55184 RepID=A0AAV9B718_ACOGR|nr:hypothetical protein QJS04_geneDACA013074 [Acorus gramineus]